MKPVYVRSTLSIETVGKMLDYYKRHSTIVSISPHLVIFKMNDLEIHFGQYNIEDTQLHFYIMEYDNRSRLVYEETIDVK